MGHCSDSDATAKALARVRFQTGLVRFSHSWHRKASVFRREQAGDIHVHQAQLAEQAASLVPKSKPLISSCVHRPQLSVTRQGVHGANDTLQLRQRVAHVTGSRCTELSIAKERKWACLKVESWGSRPTWTKWTTARRCLSPASF